MSTTVSNPRRNVAGRIQVALIGCNHRTASVELRERVSFTQQQALDAADELRKQGILEEAVVLSTCNRSELYGVPAEGGAALTQAMEEFFTSFHGLNRGDVDGKFYRWTGREAVLHLYRVAAGIDSMMLGEAEILGQLRTAYNLALEHGATGPVLNRVFQGALEVGKRVRAETEVGARPMSVALAGVKLAERVFGNLKGHVALIVGAGAVAEQVVEQLRSRGIGKLEVVNRSFDRAADLAARFNGNAVPWESLEKVLSEPDILITSAGGSGPILTRKMLERAIEKRNGRPVFVIDLGVPRNVESSASGLYNLYLYNIDDLGEVVEQNKKAREAEVPRVETLIAEHVGKFETWRATLEAGSIFDDLRASFHEQRKKHIEETLKQMPEVSPDEHARITRITEELIERILNEPGERLRTGRGMRGRLAAVEALRHIFGLDDSKL
ncbi:MAG TPA: glutamyl-tRNA reductase [Candidatus Acidoferrales bacterium]|jgi:glutamyl-tRNA reductase|nr:glutamyl-tRNA reductase [Candidatus Acidoferrales bacterium]